MNHGRLRKTGTAAGLVPLLLVVGLPTAAAAAGSCEGWNTVEFFASATVEEVTACLRAGRDPNRPDRQGLTALHRAARETGDPAVIEALLEAGANPRASSNAGRRPGHFARKNNKIKNSDAYQRLRMLRAPKADWSRVQAVSHNAKIAVRLYEDVASQRHRKITGRFDSATADSITLRFKDGQTRTIEKGAVRKVLIYRPFAKRSPGWVAMGVAIIFVEITGLGDPLTGLDRLKAYARTLPLAAPFFYGSRMKGIYKIPAKHRMLMLPQGGKQPGDQDNASEKQEDPGRPKARRT